jgi:hypothetical protein
MIPVPTNISLIFNTSDTIASAKAVIGAPIIVTVVEIADILAK